MGFTITNNPPKVPEAVTHGRTLGEAALFYVAAK